MKKILSLMLAVLMLAACGCTAADQPAEDASYVADIMDADELTPLATQTHKEVRAVTTKYAYVRSGKYGDMTWREINRELKLDTNNDEPLGLKNNGKTIGDNTREILLEFDLEKIAKFNFRNVFLSLSWISAPDNDYCVDVHLLESKNWDSETVTYNDRPTYGKLLADDIPASSINLTDAIIDCINAGEKVLSIAVVGSAVTSSNYSVNPKTTALVATTANEVNFFIYELVEDEAANKAIWDYAQTIFDDWSKRYVELKNTPLNPDVKMVVSDADEFNKIVYSGDSGFGNWTLEKVSKPHETRTYEALDDLGKYTDYEKHGTYGEDIYGGWMNPDMRQEATGFFYSKKIDGRWWFIDPLGYPCIVRTISGPTINYLGSPNQKKAALDKYGTSEKWTIATIRWLKTEVGFNAARNVSSVEEPCILEKATGGFAGGYGSKLGTNKGGGGSTTFYENNTMNVFDPGFVEYADQKAESALVAEKDNPLITGYTTDNELPMDVNMLTNYLTLDISKPVNHYSYAAAWTFMIHMTGEENPSIKAVTDELKELFRGFVYDRYFNVVDTAFEKYDPNHMNLGCRFLTKVKDAPWVLRFASLYLDGMTINWYGQWTPNAEDIYRISQYADLPLEVTEFYTKAMENDGSFDDPSDPLKNTRGAGWIVRTQQDRGDFYENFTLRLLETRAFVSWQWHQYIDDDDSPEVIFEADGVTWRDQSNIDANKGIVNNWHEPYEELCESMAQINFNVYRLALHFDAKYAKK